MKKYSHISFDVWNTLIKPNKEFSVARNQMIAQILDLPVDTISNHYTLTKRHLDALGAAYGLGCSTAQAWRQLIHFLSLENPEIAIQWNCGALIGKLSRKTLDLFDRFPPIVEPDVIEAIEKLHTAGVTMCIASNSNFIPGFAMQSFLINKFGDNKFKAFIFSDQIGMAKPSFQFFQRVKSCFNAPVHDILHIGDDQRYDTGSELIGIRCALVDAKHTIPWLVDHTLIYEA